MYDHAGVDKMNVNRDILSNGQRGVTDGRRSREPENNADRAPNLDKPINNEQGGAGAQNYASIFSARWQNSFFPFSQHGRTHARALCSKPKRFFQLTKRAVD
jgi:hypothetical protein